MNKKIEDLVREADQGVFTGREDELRIFEDLLGQDGGLKILNIFGIGGIGKTFLIREYAQRCKEKKILVTLLDAREVRDPLEIMLSVRDQLRTSNKKVKGYFSDFDKALQKIFRSVEKLLKTGAKATETTPYVDTISTAMGSVGGGAAGAPLGPAGVIIGTGLGAIIGQAVGNIGLKGIGNLTTRGLKLEEALFLINWSDNLTQRFARALNDTSFRFGKLVFLVDTVEYLSITLDQWLRDRLFLKLSTNSLLIFSGRDPICSKFSEWLRYRPLIKEHELTEFSEPEAKEFLARKGVLYAELVKYIIDHSKYLPWALGLFSDLARLKGIRLVDELNRTPELYGNVDKIATSFLRQIDDEELRNLIIVASIFRWFTEELLQCVSQVDVKKLKILYRKLQDFSFVRVHTDGSLYIHDTVRSFIVGDLKAKDEEKYRTLNRTGAEYFDTALADAGKGSYPVGRILQLLRAKLYHTLCWDEAEGISLFYRLFKQQETYAGFSFKDSILPEVAAFPFEKEENNKWSTFGISYQEINTGYWDTAQSKLETLLNESALDSRLQVEVQCALGELYIGRGRYRDALRLYEELLQQQKMNEVSKFEITRTLMQLSNVCAILNQYEKAEQFANEGIEICESHDDLPGEAWLLYSLGTSYRLKGDIKKAVKFLQRSYRSFSELGDEYCIAFTRLHLGRVYTLDGQLEKAKRCLKKSREDFSQRIASKYDEANTILFLGNIYRFEGKWQKAEQCYHEALMIHEGMHSEREIAPLYGSLGIVSYKQGKRTQALEYLKKSYNMKLKQEYNRGRAITLLYFGDYYAEDNEWNKAIAAYKSSSRLADDLGAIYPQVAARLKLYRCYYLAHKTLTEISSEVEVAEHLAQEYHYPHELAMIRMIQGHIAMDDSEVEKAQERYYESCAYASKYNKYILERVLGEIEVKLKDVCVAADIYEKTLPIRRNIEYYRQAKSNITNEDI
jgi:tetratricopeptide (TPR) repeat protein